jgi:hypothetical protein
LKPIQEPNQELIEKYYLVLIKLKKELELNRYIRMSTWAKDNKIGIISLVVLKKCGIIKSVSTNRRDPEHIWNTIEPTRQMAAKVIKTMNSTLREDKRRRKSEKEALAAAELALAETVEAQKEVEEVVEAEVALAERVTEVIAIAKASVIETAQVPQEIPQEVVLAATTILTPKIEVKVEPIFEPKILPEELETPKAQQQQVPEQPRYLPAVQTNDHDDYISKETSFAIYLFGVPIFKLKRTR